MTESKHRQLVLGLVPVTSEYEQGDKMEGISIVGPVGEAGCGLFQNGVSSWPTLGARLIVRLSGIESSSGRHKPPAALCLQRVA